MMKNPVNQTAEGIGEVMQLISVIIESLLFAILVLFILKYFFIGIFSTCIILFIILIIFVWKN